MGMTDDTTDPLAVSSPDELDLGAVRREMADEFDIALESREKRTRALAYGEIRWIARRLDIDESIEENARDIFDRAHEEKLLPGRGRRPIAAAALFAAIRCQDSIISTAEMLDHSLTDASTTRQTYQVLNRELNLPTRPPDPRAHIERLAEVFGCPSGMKDRAKEIAGEVRNRTQDRALHPGGIAAASFYAAAQERDWPITQAKLADFVGATRVTIGVIYREEIAEHSG